MSRYAASSSTSRKPFTHPPEGDVVYIKVRSVGRISKRKSRKSKGFRSEGKKSNSSRRNPIVPDERHDVDDFLLVVKSYGMKRKIDKVANPQYNQAIIETIKSATSEHQSRIPTRPSVRISTSEPYKGICVTAGRYDRLLTYYETMYDLFDDRKITLSQIKEVELWFFLILEPPCLSDGPRKLMRWKSREMSKCERYISGYFPLSARQFASKIQSHIRKSIPVGWEKEHEKKVNKLYNKINTGLFIKPRVRAKPCGRARVTLNKYEKKSVVNLSNIGLRRK